MKKVVLLTLTLFCLGLTQRIAGADENKSLAEYHNWHIYCADKQVAFDDCVVMQSAKDPKKGSFVAISFAYASPTVLRMRVRYGPPSRADDGENNINLMIDGHDQGFVGAKCVDGVCQANFAVDEEFARNLAVSKEVGINFRVDNNNAAYMPFDAALLGEAVVDMAHRVGATALLEIFQRGTEIKKQPPANYAIIYSLGYGSTADGPTFYSEDACRTLGAAGYVEWGLVLSKKPWKNKIELGSYAFNCVSFLPDGSRSPAHPMFRSLSAYSAR